MSAKTRKHTAARRIAASPRPTHDAIALCALSIWEAEGRPQGRALDHWLQAEARLAQASRKVAPARRRGAPQREPDNRVF